MLALFALLSPALAAPLCPPAEVEKIREAIVSIESTPALPELSFMGPDGSTPPPPPPEPPTWQRFDFAAMAVSQACALPAGLEKGLSSVAQVPPDMRQVVIFSALAEDQGTLLAMCGPQGPALLASAGMGPRDEAVRSLVTGCSAAERGFATEAELLAASLPRVVSALTLHGVLEQAGDPNAEALSRLLLGLPLDRP